MRSMKRLRTNFHSERVVDIASRIDCVAFDEYNVPTHFIEVVHTLGTLTGSMFRLNEMTIVYRKNANFLIVASENFRRKFEEKIEETILTKEEKPIITQKSIKNLPFFYYFMFFKCKLQWKT